jgi:hypothetical protein
VAYPTEIFCGSVRFCFTTQSANAASFSADGPKKRGRPPNPVKAKLMHEQGCSNSTAKRKLAKRALHRCTVREKVLAETTRYCLIIKPTDTWSFDPQKILYPRIDDSIGHGYAPGDLYANCLCYFARSGDLVVAPMAGSGMIHRVNLDCAVWTRGPDQPWDSDLRMFDLTPRGPYRSLIQRHDLCTGFPPIERPPDYVVMDVPYLDMCRGQYSDRSDRARCHAAALPVRIGRMVIAL